MRVIIAPDSFKECLPAHSVSAALAEGVRRACPNAEIVEVPLADGGEGTVESLVRATSGTIHPAMVTGPLGEPVRARFGILGDGVTAVLEMAAASGLELTPRERRNPLITTTFGTGELIRAALGMGARRLLVGIGGSATNDGGAGLAEALGYRLLDAEGNPIPRGGGGLARLARIDASGRDSRLTTVPIAVACDVTNPLTGPHGASAIYGPQKGATPPMIATLDANLAHFAAILRRDLGADVANVPGAGAAGGLGAGLLAFTQASLRRGIELVMEAVNLRGHLLGADLCLTGEGALDRSSLFGKTAVGVAALAREVGVPVVVFAGAVFPEAVDTHAHGVTAYFAITHRPCTLEDAFSHASIWLADTAAQVIYLANRISPKV